MNSLLNIPTMGYPYANQPFSNVAPYTHRASVTNIQYVESIRQYMLDVIIPWVASNDNLLDAAIEKVVADFSAGMATLVNDLNERLTDQDADIVAARAYVDAAVQTIINNTIQVTDPVMTGVFNIPGSNFRLAIRAAVTADTATDIDAITANNSISKSIRIQGPTLNAMYLAEVQRRLRVSTLQAPLTVKIVCQGDSTFYGQDTNSADIVGPDPIVPPNGIPHVQTRSPFPWPAVMQTNLTKIYPFATISVENRGYSGDYSKGSYDRWMSINPNAQVAILGLGINEGNGTLTSIPVEFRKNVPLYVEWMEKIILKYLSWQTGVILALPTRQRGTDMDVTVDSMRRALRSLAARYNCPVVDMQEFMITASRNSWSDDIHFNTKGNEMIAAKMAALFIGLGPYEPNKVHSGTKLSIRRTIDGTVRAQSSIVQNSAYLTPRENDASNGIGIGFGSGGIDPVSTFWSIYVEDYDTVVFPLAFVSGANSDSKLEVILDFGVEQGQNIADKFISKTANAQLTREPSSIAIAQTSTASVYHFDPTDPTSVGLRITTPGLHTLEVKHYRSVTGANAIIEALEFFNYRLWRVLHP